MRFLHHTEHCSCPQQSTDVGCFTVWGAAQIGVAYIVRNAISIVNSAKPIPVFWLVSLLLLVVLLVSILTSATLTNHILSFFCNKLLAP